VEVILEQRGSGAYNLFHPELITMRRLLDTVKRRAGRKSLYLPINAGVALVALTALRKIGLRLPVDVDNLRALRQNQASLHRSDLPGLLPEFTGPEEAISRVVASPRC